MARHAHFTRFPLIFLIAAALQAQSSQDIQTKVPLRAGEPIAIGFLGGFEHWNDEHRGVRQVALRLRSMGYQAETFGNHRRKAAYRFLLRALDTNHDGHLDDAEKQQARVAIYGHSLGGNATVWLARRLERLGVPVMLTVQVDSVGLHDGRIPANVHEALNYYQHEWLTFQGQDNIVAADPAKTTIIGSYRFYYPPFLPSVGRPETWVRRHLGGGHARMEADPVLWIGVQLQILKSLGLPDVTE